MQDLTLMTGLYSAGLALIAVILFLIWSRRGSQVKTQICARCGRVAQHGYSTQAESRLEDIQPLCTNCLVSKLDKEYQTYSGKALVVQPAEGYPCYVFHSTSDWSSAFPNASTSPDVESCLGAMGINCENCGATAQYFWVPSKGLTASAIEGFLEHGASSSFLQRGPNTASVCAKCCVSNISKTLDSLEVQYLEVCAPRGASNGFVVPMGY